jgi:hypothetical protein
MTDNEIIKALECCADSPSYEYCSECLYGECTSKKGCLSELMEDTIALINSQKAEIERLRREAKIDEIEIKCTRRHRDMAKSEARKEFAERLKKNLHEYSDSVFTIVTVFREINNLLEEMESES